jgi:hypothetical protein
MPYAPSGSRRRRMRRRRELFNHEVRLFVTV